MDVYIRKLYNGRYYVISGRPENQGNSSVVEECYTRRQAERYARKNGYDLVIKSRSTKQYKEAA